MEYGFGFIGTGSMGGALAGAVCRAVGPERVVLHNRTGEKAEALARALSCQTGPLARAAGQDYVFLGVKPHQVPAVMASVAPAMKEGAVLVSMAAGLSLGQLEALCPPGTPVVRLLPNTPVAVGKGIVLWCGNGCLSPQREAGLLAALSQAGLVEPLEERLMDAGSALCGCSPAFTDLYIEALADGAVACGIPRAAALRLAARAVEGAAALALADGRHPAQLKDAVCSPGGSTIQGVRALEAHGFRSAVLEAILAAEERGRALGK